MRLKKSNLDRESKRWWLRSAAFYHGHGAGAVNYYGGVANYYVDRNINTFQICIII